MSADSPIIGFDMTPMLYGRGVSRYTSNIVRALRARQVDVRLFGSSFRANRALKAMARDFSLQAKITHKPSILAFPPLLFSSDVVRRKSITHRKSYA